MTKPVAGRALLMSLALVPAVVLAAGLLPATASLRDPPYAGHLLASRASEVVFELKTKSTPKPRFAARDVRLFCDDGSRPRVDLPAIEIHYHGGGRFSGSEYLSTSSGFSALNSVDGQLLGHGRARGRFLAYQDPYDPPGGPNEPECGTGGFQRWTASEQK
jgi:hypothetical protein